MASCVSVLLAAACVLVEGCRSGEGGACRTDSGCKPGLMCAANRTCRATKACTGNQECRAGTICTQLLGADQFSCETPAFTQKARKCWRGNPGQVCKEIGSALEWRRELLKRPEGPVQCIFAERRSIIYEVFAQVLSDKLAGVEK